MTADLETRLQRAAEAHCPGLSLPRDLGLRLAVKVFASDGNEEDRWIEATQNACPACGGSGHKGDCAAPDITAAAARVLLAAWPTDTSFDAAFAACATAYHGGDQMQDTMDRTLATVSAALRALAEVKP